MKNQTFTVSFRIDQDRVQELDAAREPFGLSRHAWARGVLLAWLDKAEESELNTELIGIRDELEQLTPYMERKLSRILFAVLTIGFQLPASEAKETVQQVLRD